MDVRQASSNQTFLLISACIPIKEPIWEAAFWLYNLGILPFFKYGQQGIKTSTNLSRRSESISTMYTFAPLTISVELIINPIPYPRTIWSVIGIDLNWTHWGTPSDNGDNASQVEQASSFETFQNTLSISHLRRKERNRGFWLFIHGGFSDRWLIDIDNLQVESFNFTFVGIGPDNFQVRLYQMNIDLGWGIILLTIIGQNLWQFDRWPARNQSNIIDIPDFVSCIETAPYCTHFRN